jgi:hypothetical protein
MSVEALQLSRGGSQGLDRDDRPATKHRGHRGQRRKAEQPACSSHLGGGMLRPVAPCAQDAKALPSVKHVVARARLALTDAEPLDAAVMAEAMVNMEILSCPVPVDGGSRCSQPCDLRGLVAVHIGQVPEFRIVKV